MPNVELTPDFEQLLKQEGLLADFRALGFSHQKEYTRWITEAKKAETRRTRMAKAVTMLKSKISAPAR